MPPLAEPALLAVRMTANRAEYSGITLYSDEAGIRTVSSMDPHLHGRELESFIKERLRLSPGPTSMLELARAAGVRPGTMYDWFSGRRTARTDSLARVAAALDVPLSHLLDVYEGRTRPLVNDQAVVAIEAAVAEGVAEAIRRLVAEGVLVSPGKTSA